MRAATRPKRWGLSGIHRRSLFLLLTLALAGCAGEGFEPEPDYGGLRAELVPTFTALPAPTATLTPLPSATPTEVYSTPTPDIFEQAGVPVMIEIPAIDVVAPVEQVGRLPSGQMDVPKIAANVAWFDESALPGQTGRTSVIAGHLDSPTGPAVFYKLRMLVPGDEMVVRYANGDRHVFVVSDKERYFSDNAPLSKIFGRNSGRVLNLITCDGAWDSGNANYQQRLVVYAKLKGSS
jgi:LPXTG-site transpeptidase (sortase) family protein